MLVKPPNDFDIYAYLHDRAYERELRQSEAKSLYFGGIAYCSRDIIIKPDLEPGNYLIFVGIPDLLLMSRPILGTAKASQACRMLV